MGKGRGRKRGNNKLLERGSSTNTQAMLLIDKVNQKKQMQVKKASKKTSIGMSIVKKNTKNKAFSKKLSKPIVKKNIIIPNRTRIKRVKKYEKTEQVTIAKPLLNLNKKPKSKEIETDVDYKFEKQDNLFKAIKAAYYEKTVKEPIPENKRKRAVKELQTSSNPFSVLGSDSEDDDIIMEEEEDRNMIKPSRLNIDTNNIQLKLIDNISNKPKISNIFAEPTIKLKSIIEQQLEDEDL